MTRPRVLLASRDPSVVAAIEQFLGLCLPNEELGHEVEKLSFSCGRELFARLDAVPPEQVRHTILVLDPAHDRAGAWQVGNMHEAGLGVRVVLSYPEIYCVFLGTGEPLWKNLPKPASPKQVGLMESHHFVAVDRLFNLLELIRLHASGFRTIFDPTSLRSLLKEAVFRAVGGERSRVHIPLAASRREYIAAVADEELPFVYLNGYVAYRAGFRSWLVSTAAEFRRLLTRPPLEPEAVSEERREAPLPLEGPASFHLLLSDWDLVYPDLKGDPPAKSLLLNEPPLRHERLLLITGIKDEEQKQLPVNWCTFRSPKPYGGFFDLLALDGGKGGNILRQRYRTWTETVNRTEVPGGRGEAAGSSNGHTAPFARGVVAGCLLARARTLAAQGPHDTEAWIHVALLAGEAKEILGGLSRTTSYEAVALQHEAEVVAEISFFGTLAQSKVEERLNALEEETAVVQRVSGGSDAESHEGKRARLNCLLQAVNTLRKHFSEHQQIEASEDCLRRITVYHDNLERPAALSLAGARLRRASEGVINFWRMVVQWIPALTWTVSWYPSFASRAGTSLWRLSWVSAAWVGLFGVAYALLLSVAPPVYTERAPALESAWSLGLWHSCLTFMLQPSVSQIEQDATPYNGLRACWWYRSALFFELLIAYLHLGLLLSVLYRRITKRAP